MFVLTKTFVYGMILKRSGFMRISAKCRYGIAALIKICEQSGQNWQSKLVSILALSEELSISKIYLEQVFSKLRSAGIVASVKGASGGYRLAKAAADTYLAEIVYALDESFSEKNYETSPSAPEIDGVITDSFNALDECIKKALSETSLESLSRKAIDKKSEQTYMFYI
jgi:Rrf2 family protein